MPPQVNPDSKVLTLRLAGNLTSGNTASSQAIVSVAQSAAAPDRPWRDVVLDLTDAHMIDSAGLNLLVSVLKATLRIGGKMQVTYRDPNIQRTLRFVGLDKRLEMVCV